MRQSSVKKFLIIISIVMVIFSLYIVYSHTNLINKVRGDTFSQKIEISSVIDGTDGGYIQLRRNSDTPIAYEWAAFENEEKFITFSIDEGEKLIVPVYITLPKKIVADDYKIDVSIIYNSGENLEKTISFVVI